MNYGKSSGSWSGTSRLRATKDHRDLRGIKATRATEDPGVSAEKVVAQDLEGQPAPQAVVPAKVLSDQPGRKVHRAYKASRVFKA